MMKTKKPKNAVKKALNALDRREEFARLAKDRTKRALRKPTAPIRENWTD